MATQIASRQIVDGAITNAKVAGGAGIVTSKLADGSLFIKADGSVAFTTAQSMGSQKITNLATGTNANDATNLAQVEALIAGLNSIFETKASVRAASTGNVNIANPGTAVFDGVTLIATERLLLRAQTAPAENGIYIFTASGSALTRSTDFDLWAEIPGAIIVVEEGSTYADYIFLSTANKGGTLNTTAITFTQVNAAGYGNSNFVDKETPAGTINGSNVTFTLANTPTAGSEHIFLNGVLQDSGDDYTISGATITMAVAPITGEKLRSSYRK